MAATTWHYFYGPYTPQERSDLVDRLSAAGVRSEPYRPELIDTAGIVFVSRADRQLLKLLNSLAALGRNQILVALLDAATPDAVWDLIHSGATDVLSGSAGEDIFRNIAARIDRWRKIDKTLLDPRVADNLVGTSRVWRKTLRHLIEAAVSGELSVLITGESGTGKELAAQLIHSLDAKRKDKNFVVLDCTTLVPDLSGSEFFGHERGSFTGAVNRREGAFALADGGTLFLDEIGELPLVLQAGLLRVVQEKRFKPVGSNTWRKTDFRLICATNVDLHEQQTQGRFRSDLYHRIATWTCKMPPLRERTDDIVPLANHFLAAAVGRKDPPAFDYSVADFLRRRAYPGNVRELYQLVQRIACRHVGDGPITCGDISESDRPDPVNAAADWQNDLFELGIRQAIFSGADLEAIKKSAEDMAETIALQEAARDGERNGRVARAAEMLRINKRTLEMHIKQRNDRLRKIAH